MPTYKLSYFNGRGLGETARLMFAYAEQPYEDHRFKDGEWPTVKPTTPCGQAPILEVDGKKLSQSKAVNRYLGKQFGLVAASDWDQARCDMIADYVDDMRSPLTKAHFEKDEKLKKTLMEKCIKEELPVFLSTFEKLLKENKGGDKFFVGDKPTWTDFVFYNTFHMLKTNLTMVPASYFEAYPKLNALFARIEAFPSVAKWIKQRPASEF